MIFSIKIEASGWTFDQSFRWGWRCIRSAALDLWGRTINYYLKHILQWSNAIFLIYLWSIWMVSGMKSLLLLDVQVASSLGMFPGWTHSLFMSTPIEVSSYLCSRFPILSIECTIYAFQDNQSSKTKLSPLNVQVIWLGEISSKKIRI